MNQTESIKALEQNIQDSKKHIEIANKLDKLISNREFRELILKGYFEEESIRLVHLKADPSMQSVASQEHILRQMDAIGSLMGYFQLLKHNASVAVKSLEYDETVRNEMLEEEAA